MVRIGGKSVVGPPLKTIGTRILATTLAAVVVAGTGAAADAATVARTDVVGDAPARYDVSRATYVNEGDNSDQADRRRHPDVCNGSPGRPSPQWV